MRVAVVSDIHGNLVALRAVLDHAAEVDSVWCLGDTVGYGPEPDACVRDLAARAHLAVAGNHDWAAIGKIGTEEFNPAAAAAARWTTEQLLAETREYLLLLPQRRTEGEYTLVHGSPRNPIWEYLLDIRTASENFPHFETRFCLFGHTHIPSYFVLHDGVVDGEYAAPGLELDLAVADRLMLNPGSVGQPRDGNPEASYLLLDTEARQASWRRVAYDVATTQARMESHGLPEALIDRLAVGR
jgi:diadenosine tetraphosphatase ApaH/serine/threonine PP2A family protein phosphatase